jgi:hypothetical protein
LLFSKRASAFSSVLWLTVQPTHAICNRKKGNKLIDERDAIDLGIPTSRDWWSE